MLRRIAPIVAHLTRRVWDQSGVHSIVSLMVSAELAEEDALQEAVEGAVLPSRFPHCPQ